MRLRRGAALAVGCYLTCGPASAAMLDFDRTVTQDSPYYTDIALDAAGNLYLSGFALSGSAARALVTKRSADGANEIWSLQFGAGQGQIATGIAVDGQGNVYVTGWTSDPNFPLKNPVQGTFGGGESDGFMLKINAAGSTLLYSTFLGGNGNDFANQIRVDSGGNAYVTGTTFSPDFQGTGSARAGETDVFVVKLNGAGSGFVYRRLLGGAESDLGNGLTVDAQGRAYVIGSTKSTDFPVKNGLQLEKRGDLDAFVAILDAAGNTEYATYLGGAAPDSGTGIAVDWLGNIFVTGLTYSEDFPLVRPFQNRLGKGDCAPPRVCGDGFVAKIDPAGSALEFSTYLGGNAEENETAVTSSIGLAFYGVAVDEAGFAYVTGTTRSSDFPVLGGLQVNPRRGASDPFLAKLQPDGGVVYSTYVGPGQFRTGEVRNNIGSSLAVDPQGNAYIAGASVPPSAGPGSESGPVGFIAKVFDLPIIPTSAPALPESPGSSAFLPVISLRRLADLSSQLSFLSPTNSGYIVEGSIDLRTWTPLFTQQPPGSPGPGGGVRR